MIHQPYFHIGLVVDSLEPAMSSIGAAMGIEWRGVIEFDLALRQGKDEIAGSIRAVYSAGGPAAIELFEPVAGSVLTAAGTGRLHHLGFWSDDLAADSQELERKGWALAATVAGDDDGPKQFALHRSADHDFYVELVDPTRMGRLFGDLMPEGLVARSGERTSTR